MEKKYQVYSVDTCFEEYAMEYQLIGAESVEDLLLHLKEQLIRNLKPVPTVTCFLELLPLAVAP